MAQTGWDNTPWTGTSVSDQGMPDNTGVSRGGQANRQFEELFSGIGGLIKGAAQVGTNYVEGNIQQDANYARDALDKDTGLDPQQFAPGGQGGTGNGPVPDEILRSQAGLQKLAAAQTQGKVTPEYYYQRLAATMKGLRAKYPGFEQEVDDAMQKATGVNPANAYRAQLFNNLNQYQTQQAEGANKLQSYVLSNSQYMNADESDSAMKDGGAKYGGMAGLAANIARRKGLEAQQDRSAKEAEYDSKNALGGFRQAVAGQAAEVVNQIGGSVGLNGQNFQDVLTGLAKNPANPEQLAQIQTQVQQLYDTQRAKMVNLRATKGFSTVSAEDANKEIDFALQPIKDIQTALQSKNYDAVARTLAQNQLTTQTATKDLYDKDHNMLAIKTLSDINPQGAAVVMQNYMAEQGGPTTYFNKTFRQDVVTPLISGDTPLNKRMGDVLDNPNMDAKTKAKTVQDMVNDYTNLFPKIEQSPQQVKAAVSGIYGSDAQGDKLWQAVKGDQKLALFAKMYNPAITDKILKAGDPEAFKTYEQSAFDRMQSIPEFSQVSGDVSQQGQGYGVHYNSTTNRLELAAPPANSGGFFSNPSAPYSGRTLAQAAVDKFNTSFKVMEPIIKGAGLSPEAGMKQILQTFNVNLDQGKPQGFWGKILGSFTNSTAKPDASTQEKDSGESPGATNETSSAPEFKLESLNAVRQEETTTPGSGYKGIRDLLGGSEGTDKGRGYDELYGYAKGPETPLTGMTVGDIKNLQEQMLAGGSKESALGRYQINKATLADFQQRLGIQDSEKFTPALQDKIADAIMDQAGYKKWLAGEMTDDEFRLKMTGRWGSMPKIPTQSFLDTARGGGASGEANPAQPGAPKAQTIPGGSATVPRSNLVYKGRTPGATSYSDGGDIDASQALLQRVVAPGTGAARPDAVTNLQPAMKTRLASLLQAAPPELEGRIGLYSAYRSPETQARLFAASNGSGHMVARPGGSQHNFGSAVDLAYKTDAGKWVSLERAPKSVKEWVAGNVESHNLKLPMDYEPWHVELAETRNFGYVSDKSKRFAGSAPIGESEGGATIADIKEQLPVEFNQLDTSGKINTPHFADLRASGGLSDVLDGMDQKPIEVPKAWGPMRDSVNVDDRRAQGPMSDGAAWIGSLMESQKTIDANEAKRALNAVQEAKGQGADIIASSDKVIFLAHHGYIFMAPKGAEGADSKNWEIAGRDPEAGFPDKNFNVPIPGSVEDQMTKDIREQIMKAYTTKK